jgi:hypothetical protein
MKCVSRYTFHIMFICHVCRVSKECQDHFFWQPFVPKIGTCNLLLQVGFMRFILRSTKFIMFDPDSKNL